MRNFKIEVSPQYIWVIFTSSTKLNLFVNNEGLVSGTLMSIQEKKSSKGTPFAIATFSDKVTSNDIFHICLYIWKPFTDPST
mgnify:CR=1 FL=1